MRFGLAGAGVVGRLRAEALRQVPGAVLAAVADPDGGRAARVAGPVPVLADHRGLARDDVDAVIVAAPAPVHEEIVLAALAAGKHVLCEKPLAPTVAACRRLVEAAARAGRILAVGFNHRYFPPIAFAKRVLDSGRLGTLDHLRVLGGHDGLGNFRAEWMYRAPLSGGGAMMDIGLHLTDLVRFLAGEVVEVQGTASGCVWQVEGSEDNALAILRTAAGVPVSYQATWSEWRGFRFRVDAYGSHGMVRATIAPMTSLVVTREPRRRAWRLYPWENLREKLRGWEAAARDAFVAELADFQRRVAGEAVPLADGMAGLRAVEVAHALYEASARGAPIRVGALP